MTTSPMLTERQKEVASTMIMRLSRAHALAYLEGQGYKMSSTTLGRIKSWLKRTELPRIHQIAKSGFESQHLNRIETCERIEQLMWKEYFLEKDPYKRVLILEKIKELQPYISTYYETTRGVIEIGYGTREKAPSLPEYTDPAATPREPESESWTVPE